MTFTTGHALADDTEIFFGQQYSQPNVMLLLDISGSMGADDDLLLDTMKDALYELLDNTSNINVGLMAYNGLGVQFLHPVKPIEENREDLRSSVFALEAAETTPSVAALYIAKQYFAGDPMTVSRRRSPFTFEYTCPTANSADITAACWVGIRPGGAIGDQETYKGNTYYGTGEGVRLSSRLPHPDTYILGTGGSIQRHDHCTTDLNHPSCSNEEIVGSATWISPITSACQANHVVLLTDGVPYADDLNKRKAGYEVWEPIADEIQTDIGITGCRALPEDTPSGGRCGADLAEYMANNDLNTLIDGTNTVLTHTIGLDLDDEWLESVSDASVTAGALSTDPKGTYATADSTDSLLAAFESVTQQAIDSSNNTFVAPAVTLDQFTRLSHRNDMYLALFQPSSTQRWAGNLKRYQFDNNEVKDINGNVVLDTTTGTFQSGSQSWWSATADGADTTLGGAASLFNKEPRPVYTYTGSEISLTKPVNALHEGNNLVTAGMLGVPAADRTNLIQWARGVDVDNESDGSTTRLQMGDPLHSRPAILTYGGTEAAPDSVAFIGTNEGFLHAINTSDGEEVFSFIPTDLLGNLDTYYKNESTISRLYGIDGDLTLWTNDVDNSGTFEKGTDHAYLYMGMRRGGSQYYALDVTDKDEPEFLWSIHGGPGGTTGFEKLAQSWSKPTLSKVTVDGTATDVLIFAGGYNSTLDHSNMRSPDTIGNDMFIVNATTGDLIWNSATAAASLVDTTAMQYSIPSDLRVIDVNGDQFADQIYVGDMGGQIWRFDINNLNDDVDSLVSGGVIANLASDSDIANNRQFFYSPDVAMVTTEGTRYLSISIGSGNRANPLETSVDNRFYMIRQKAVSGAPAGYGIVDTAASTTTTYRAITEADLYNASQNMIQDTNSAVAQSASTTLQAKEGWLIELENSGEKALSASLTVNNDIIFTSYLPESTTSNLCAPIIGGGRSYSVSVTDATPSVGESVASRYNDLPTPGIPSAPTPFIDSDGELSILVNLNEVATPAYEEVIKVYWTEQPDY